MDYVIETTVLPAQHCAVVSGQVAHDGIGPFLRTAFGQVMAVLGASGNAAVGPPMSRYGLTSTGFDISAGFPCAVPVVADGGVEPLELPAGLVASTTHVGEYEQLAGAYRALEGWFEAHGFRPVGAPWEVYVDGPGVAEPRTVVTWPCAQVT